MPPAGRTPKLEIVFKDYTQLLADSVTITNREDPGCGWVGGQCWSNTACSAIGIAWSSNGDVWEEAEHVPAPISQLMTMEHAHQDDLVSIQYFEISSRNR